MLFIAFVNEIIERWSIKAKKLHVGYRSMQILDISEGAFADDIVIIA